MSRLEKSVCIIYICLAVILGGIAAYCKVSFNDIALNEFFASKIDEEEKENSKDYKKYGQVVNVDSYLLVREKPNLESNIHYGLYKGMTFEILDKNGEWYSIQHDDIIGYVNKDYVEEYDTEPPYPIYDKISSETAKKLSNARAIKAELTAYCNCIECSEAWGAQTAMQTHTRVGVIAAPKDIDLGSKVYIPSLKYYKEDGIFEVEDRGGGILVKDDGTYIIDVWLPSHDEVEEFGRQKTTIYLME